MNGRAGPRRAAVAALLLLLAAKAPLAQEEGVIRKEGVDTSALASEHFLKRAMSHSRNKKYEKALAELDRALEIKSTARAYRMRGAVHLRLGNRLLALADFSACIDLEPDEPTHYVTRALIYQVEGRNEQAIEDYTAAIALKPNSGKWHSNRGMSYMRLGLFEEAEQDFNRAVKLQPTYAEGVFNRAILLHRLERYEEAVEGYRMVLELKPKWGDVRRNMQLAQAGQPIDGG